MGARDLALGVVCALVGMVDIAFIEAAWSGAASEAGFLSFAALLVAANASVAVLAAERPGARRVHVFVHRIGRED